MCNNNKNLRVASNGLVIVNDRALNVAPFATKLAARFSRSGSPQTKLIQREKDPGLLQIHSTLPTSLNKSIHRHKVCGFFSWYTHTCTGTPTYMHLPKDVTEKTTLTNVYFVICPPHASEVCAYQKHPQTSKSDYSLVRER